MMRSRSRREGGVAIARIGSRCSTRNEIAALVPTHDECFDREHQRLDAQQHCVDKPHGVDSVKHKALEGGGVLRLDQVVIAGVGVDDATAPGCNALKTAFIK